jgi:hypothetical protein
MNRLVVGVAALVAALSGCASPARYVERTGDTGVVAIPANTDSFPNYNRSEAMALIQKHVGGNFEIVEEREVATGKKTFNDQHVNNEQTWNTSNPLLPANRQTVQNTTTTQDVTEWRIAYRKKVPTSIGAGSLGSAVAPAGGMQSRAPVGAGVSSVQPAGGIIPSVGPASTVVPAGPLAPVNPTSSAMPMGPIAPTGGPGVYGSASAVIGTTN